MLTPEQLKNDSYFESLSDACLVEILLRITAPPNTIPKRRGTMMKNLILVLCLAGCLMMDIPAVVAAGGLGNYPSAPGTPDYRQMDIGSRGNTSESRMMAKGDQRGRITAISGNTLTIRYGLGKETQVQVDSTTGLKPGMVAICEEDCQRSLRVGDRVINVQR